MRLASTEIPCVIYNAVYCAKPNTHPNTISAGIALKAAAIRMQQLVDRHKSSLATGGLFTVVYRRAVDLKIHCYCLKGVHKELTSQKLDFGYSKHHARVTPRHIQNFVVL